MPFPQRMSKDGLVNAPTSLVMQLAASLQEASFSLVYRQTTVIGGQAGGGKKERCHITDFTGISTQDKEQTRTYEWF